MLFSHGSQSSRGVAILFARDFSPTIRAQVTDQDGRFLGVDVELNGQTLSLCSIYAPTQDSPREQQAFLNGVQELIEELVGLDLILGGDLNCTLNPKLDKNTTGTSPDSAGPTRTKIELLKEEMDLSDVWRVRNPTKKGFTFSRGQYSSRLDYFLISSHLMDRVSKMDITNLAHSDHAMIAITIGRQDSSRGPGLWRFDVDLLTDNDFTSNRTDFITDWEPPRRYATPTRDGNFSSLT